jgi:cytochrome c peroxidase
MRVSVTLRAAAAGLAAAMLVDAGPAWAHGAAEHAKAGPGAEILAPGYGPLGFTPPTPGSYTLPPLRTAADGEVLAADGSARSLYEVFGDEVVLLSFVYASCSDVNGCPLATAVLHRVRARLAEAPATAARVRLVSLSFDPERDTPEVMRRYAAPFEGRGVDWTFLTTESEAKLQPILEAYGQPVTRELDASGRPSGNIAHILRVFLIDRQRRIRNVYTVSFLHADTLLSDIETILLDAPRDREAAAVATAAGVRLGPGDDRAGYERRDYRSASENLAARRGRPADLSARLRETALGLPPVPAPAANPPTPEKIALGRKLFYDRRLSQNGTLSCAMCHIPEQGFTSNELATSVGIEGRSVRRNAPSLYNVAHAERLFHDGRETLLEQQVWGPLLARNEMGNPAIGTVVERIRALPDYAGLFDAAFPERGLAMETIGMALASYERALVAGGSAFDRWFYGRESGALPEAAQRGFRLFGEKAGCSACHTLGADFALFSDGGFHNTGIGYAASMSRAPAVQRIPVGPGRFLEIDRAIVEQVGEPIAGDLGRYEITEDPADRWRYKTPTLRNVALSAPYMHDGSLATLGEVVEFYDRGGVPNPALDPLIRPLGLSDRERADLVAFLRSLTGGDVEVLVGDAFAAPIGDTH